jgi:hypothetical protein
LENGSFPINVGGKPNPAEQCRNSRGIFSCYEATAAAVLRVICQVKLQSWEERHTKIVLSQSFGHHPKKAPVGAFVQQPISRKPLLGLASGQGLKGKLFVLK